MKDGQTFHEINCPCGFCIIGDTKHPIKCQATFKEHCQYPKCDCDRLAELEVKLAGEYVGGMTEYWQRQKNFLLTKKDPIEVEGPWYPRPELDDPTKPDIENKFTGIVQSYITNPAHGGKVTCHTCNGFVAEGDAVPYLDHQHPNEFPKAHFHKDCYNPYEHYYGPDRPID